MKRMYANENFSRQAVIELRRLGHDVLTSQDAGNAGRGVSDLEVLLFAIADERAVLTFNRRDFVALHRQVAPPSGIVVCTFDPDFIALATRIDRALSGVASIVGQLIRIHRPNQSVPKR